jgi:hypothetical protein
MKQAEDQNGIKKPSIIEKVRYDWRSQRELPSSWIDESSGTIDFASVEI